MKILSALLLWAALLSAAPKNVVLIVTDDQSPDMGVYGNTAIKTPNMDRLAEAGTRFRNAFCTTASCSASRSVILTGLHNHANGHYGHQHHFHKFSAYDNIVSLPVYMKAAGYRTARAGKYHVAPEVVYEFDQAIPGSGRSPVQLANNCQRFLSEDSDKPFFLYWCTDDPHRGGGTADELPYAPNRFGNPAPTESEVRALGAFQRALVVPPNPYRAASSNAWPRELASSPDPSREPADAAES